MNTAHSWVSGSSSVKADLGGSAPGLWGNCSDDVLPRPDLGRGFFPGPLPDYFLCLLTSYT